MGLIQAHLVVGDAGLDKSAGLGDVRLTPGLPSYDFHLLKRACSNTKVVANPNASPGCSPIIRAFLIQSGLPFAVAREMANDDHATGHLSGNAIDIVAATGTPNAAAALADICNLLRQSVSMFTRISHVDTDFPDDGLTLGSVDAALANSTTNSIHIESTGPTILAWLSGAQYAPQRSTVLAGTDEGPFANRLVHYDGHTSNNGAANGVVDAPATVTFW